MKNKIAINAFALLAILMAILLVPAALVAQEAPAEHGSIEVGGRGMTGAVDGRQDLQQSVTLPLKTSKLNEYRDLKNGLFVRGLQADFALGPNFFNIQSHSSLFNDQSWLANFGQYGKFKLQFRWDETPHIFSNTTRSLFSPLGGGTYRLSPAIRNQLWGASNINPTLVTATLDPAVATPANAALLPAVANAMNSVVSADSFMTSSLVRKSGSIGAGFDLTPNWNVSGLFSRERETGTRPIGVLIGGGVEVPEPIAYTTDNYKVGTEYSATRWGVQFGYHGTTFDNQNSALTVDNPFSPAPNTALNLGGQCPAVPAACVTSTANGDIPRTTLTINGSRYTIASVTGVAKMDLYPNNRADNLDIAGAFDLAKNVRFMASVVPGWASQNDPFLPYTTNLTAGPSPTLPATSANAKRQTLAMNYTITGHPLKHVELTAKYRSYDYNNNTPILTLTPVNTDGAVGTLSPEQNTPWSYFKKNAELTATYFFDKKNSAKIGYEFESMDREHRDVSHTQENSLVTDVDLNPNKDVSLRVSYRHSDRFGDAFAYEAADPNYAFAQVADSRRFDEAPRLRDRGEVLLQYNPQALQRLTLSASAGTTQDNYNRRAGNEAAAGVLPGMGSFYSYGVLKDFSRYYSFEAGYALAAVSLFADYTRENYSTRLVSEQLGSLVLSCATVVNGVCTRAGPSTRIYNPVNDWTSFNRNLVDTWSVGVDGDLSKKLSFSTSYSLSAAKGNTWNAGVNCAVGTVTCRTNNPRWFLDGPVVDSTGAILTNPNNPAKDAAGNVIPGVFLPYSSAPPLFYGGGPTASNYGLNFPETVTRLHEAVIQIKFKATKNVIPKFEYRYEKFSNVDYQTDASLWSQGMNPYMYLGGTVDPNDSRGTSKYLFLGASSPSYHAHVLSATIEYHF